MTTTRTRIVSEYMLVLALCLVSVGESERVIDEESGESADEVVTGARRGVLEQSGSMDQWVMGHGSMDQWVMGQWVNGADGSTYLDGHEHKNL